MFSKFHKIFDSFTKLERQVFQGASIVFAFSIFLNGVNLFYQTTVLTPISGGTYTEGVVGQPIAINPLIAGSNDIDRDLIEVVFSDLTELADSAKVNDDHRVWTVTLKNGLAWSDGEPITADDVVFTLETMQDPDAHSPSFAAWHGVIAERMSEREVRFTLKTPYAFFLDNLKEFKVVPRHIFGTIPTANLRLSDYNFEPIGNGPYVFSSYTKRKDGFITDYTFTANPHFAGTETLIKELKFKFFADYQEAIEAFNHRAIDGLGGISVYDLPDIKIGHQTVEFNIPRYYAVFLNPGTSLPLREKAVRVAFDAATDREKLRAVALKGYGQPIGGPLYPGIEGYDAAIGTGARFSLETAERTLEDAGWKRGDDGVRRKRVEKDDFRLAFDMIVPDIDFLIEATKILEEDWKTIGVAVNRIVRSPTEITNDVIKTRNYQMLVFGNILKANPDVFSFWHSSEKFRPGLNLSFYENKKADALLESIRKDFDTVSRTDDVALLQEIIHADKPAIFLFSPNYLYLTPKNLGGIPRELLESPANRFAHIADWYLKTARSFK